MVGALIDRAIGPLFPTVEGTVTVRAPVRGLSGTMAGSDLGQAATDFAAQLAGLAAIVAVEIKGRSPAMGATTSGRQGRRAPTLDRRQGRAVGFRILGTQLLPVQGGWSGLDGGRFGQRGLGVDGEIPIVGVVFSEIIAGQDLGFPLGKNLLQLSDEGFQLWTAELFAEPQDESCYFLQGGESPRNGVPFDWSQRVVTSPPFVFSVKVKPSLPAPSQLWKLPPGGNGGKIKKPFSPRFHRAWKTLRRKHSEFPTVSTAAATSPLISFTLQTAGGRHAQKRPAQPGYDANSTLEGEKRSGPDSYRKYNKLAA